MIDFIATYVLMKIKEGRSGKALDAGRVSVFYALENTAIWTLLIAANLIIDPILLSHHDWQMFRGGVALAATAGLLLAGTSFIQTKMHLSSDGTELATRILSGMNTIICWIAVTVMVGLLLYGLLEVMVTDVEMRWFKEPLKIYIVALLTLAAFGAANTRRFIVDRAVID